MNNKEFTRGLGEKLFHILMEGYDNGNGINTVEEVANRIKGMIKTCYPDKFDSDTFNELIKDMEQCYNKTTSKEVCLRTTFCAGTIILQVIGDRGYVVDDYTAKLTPKRGKANVEKALAKINKDWDKNYTLEDVTIVKF